MIKALAHYSIIEGAVDSRMRIALNFAGALGISTVHLGLEKKFAKN